MRPILQFLATNVYEINASTGDVFHYVSLTYDDFEADELMRSLQQVQPQPQQQDEHPSTPSAPSM